VSRKDTDVLKQIEKAGKGAARKKKAPGKSAPILITGFDPFGGEKVNAAWEAVKALPDGIDGVVLQKVCVPTVFGRCADVLREAALRMDTPPRMILMIGQAASRASVTPEMVALNIRCAPIPDNDGIMPRGQSVLPGGENALFCPLPLIRIADELKEEDLRVSLSFHAGTFVCNDLYYSALAEFTPRGIPCCFIHVPLMRGQSEDPYFCVDPEVIMKALKRLIQKFLEYTERPEQTDIFRDLPF